MFDIKTLVRLTRMREYLHKLILIFPLIFLISPQNILTYKTILIFFASFFLTTFIYSINDVEDAEDDHHNIKKRKRNPIANGELTKKQGYLFSFFLPFMGLLLLLAISRLIFLIGFILTSIGFLYSWKPIRLKSVPVMDVISHVICLGALQFSITYLAFRSFDLLFISFLMIFVPYSFAACIFQQLRDFEVDKKAKINNTVQKLGKFNPTKLFVVLTMIIISGFIILCSTLSLEGVFLSSLIFLGSIPLLRCDRFFKLHRL